MFLMLKKSSDRRQREALEAAFKVLILERAIGGTKWIICPFSCVKKDEIMGRSRDLGWPLFCDLGGPLLRNSDGPLFR